MEASVFSLLAELAEQDADKLQLLANECEAALNDFVELEKLIDRGNDILDAGAERVRRVNPHRHG
jgi:hypothetical protein